MKSLSKFVKENPLKTNSLLDLSSISSSINLIPQPPFNLDNKILNEKQQDEEVVDEEKQKNFEFNKIATIDNLFLLSLIEVADEYLSIERAGKLEYIRCSIIEAYCILWPTTQEKINVKYREISPVLKPKNNVSEKSKIKTCFKIVFFFF